MYRFPPPVSFAATAKLSCILLKKQLHTSIGKDPLSHGEPLLVVSTSDPKHIALRARQRSHKHSCRATSRQTFHSSPKKSASSSCDIRFSKNGLLIGYTQQVQCSQYRQANSNLLSLTLLTRRLCQLISECHSRESLYLTRHKARNAIAFNYSPGIIRTLRPIQK